MAIDYKQISAYLNQVRKIEETLGTHQELYDRDKLDEFRQITAALERNIQIAQQQSRKLSIGIVGAVKAGKSSFLNACIFDGKEFLPKAATPMTAALTKITYSETPRAVVHFYDQEDWDKVLRDSEKYDAGLKSAYEKYCQQQERLQMQMQSQASYMVPLTIMSMDEYERKQYRCPSETQRGAKELTRMAKNPAILEKLGRTDTLDGDVMGKLNDYVGANGTYTPIVSYVELQSNSSYVKDLEIVDTPGLNDPIVSRGIVTKQFLRSCDVVLLLSPCSQFMDSGTITLMASSLPSAGVREVIVIGSKLDSGILNESCEDFPSAYKAAVDSYHTQFQNSIAQVRTAGKHSNFVSKIGQSSGSLLFVSSACFSIVQKQKSGEPLDENEELVLNNLKRFSGFDERYLLSIGGINKVKSALGEVLKRKAEIIEGKNDSLLDDARRSHLRVLDSILQEVVSSRTKLETVSADDLRRRVLNIRDVIDTSRDKLMYLFDNAVTSCEAKIQQIRPQLTIQMQHHQNIDVEAKTRDEHETVKTGFLGLRREEIRYTVTNHGVDTSCVVSNIQQYASKCQTYVNTEFQQIFNKEQFAQRVKEVVLTAFQKSGREFDPDDILLPLRNVLDKISIPHMELDYTWYIDEVETHFKSGYAENEEIHRLKSLQTRLLNEIEKALGEQLRAALADISKALQQQAIHFADNIEGKLCNELEKLQGQVAERERYISEYVQFAEAVRGLKSAVSGL